MQPEGSQLNHRDLHFSKQTYESQQMKCIRITLSFSIISEATNHNPMSKSAGKIWRHRIS